MKIDHLPDLNRQIKNLMFRPTEDIWPFVIDYCEGMEFPQYRITIEKIDCDTFVDANGQTWKKVSN